MLVAVCDRGRLCLFVRGGGGCLSLFEVVGTGGGQSMMVVGTLRWWWLVLLDDGGRSVGVGRCWWWALVTFC